MPDHERPPSGQNRLRSCRLGYGLTQQEVAEEITRLAWERDRRVVGVDAESVSRWERGERRPRKYYRQLLCLLFGTTEPELGFRRPLPLEETPPPGGARDGSKSNGAEPERHGDHRSASPVHPASPGRMSGLPPAPNGAGSADAHLEEACDGFRAERDWLGAADCFTQGYRLARQTGEVPAWLVRASADLADAGHWSALDVLSRQPELDGSPVAALAVGLQGITLRARGPIDEALARFDTALRSPGLRADATTLLHLHRAHVLHSLGRFADAQREYDKLTAQAPDCGERARVPMAYVQYALGCFPAALALAEPLPADDFAHASALQLIGHVNRVNGNLIEAEAVYRSVLVLAAETRSLALESSARTSLAETLCWLNQTAGRDLALEAVRFNRIIGSCIDLPKAYAALAIAEHGEGALTRAEAAVEAGLAVVASSGYRPGAVFPLVARVFQRLVARETTGALRAHEELGALTEELGAHRFWWEITGCWLRESGVEPRGHGTSQVEWLASRRTTAARWRAVLRHRRA
jgi:tetratricopeptide (TPR) repeat protein/transcriptional regulator with XRE-family HTH domain